METAHRPDSPNTFSADSKDQLSRYFSWGMLFFLVAYLINNTLVHSQSWPGVKAITSSFADWRVWAQVAIYAAALLIAWLLVKGKTRSLRQFRGPMVHLPLLALGFLAGAVTRTLGFHWLALLIVLAELAIVITRFIFSYEQAFMGDLVRFWYAALFLFASAYTLLQEGHVRVDIFYSAMRQTRKGFVNSFGAVFFGIALCWTIIVIGLGGKSAIIYGPLANFEVSQSGFGMYTKYWMAGFLGVFAITMLLQFVAQFLESVADVRQQPGARTVNTEIAH